MRELDFMPEWYPRFRRKRHFALVQAWSSAAIMLVLVVGSFATLRAIHKRQSELGEIERDLAQTQIELRQLDEKLALRRQLEKRKQVMVSVGRHIEAARLLALLDGAKPTEMGLSELKLEEAELVRPGEAVGSLLSTRKPSLSRRLTISIKGVTPTDMDVANLLVALNRFPFVEKASLVGSENKTESGKAMRAFEVGAQIDLSDAR